MLSKIVIKSTNKNIAFLNGYPIKVILLYTPLEENLENCFMRNSISQQEGTANYRSPCLILNQFLQIYQFKSDDKQGIKINQKKIAHAIDKSIFHIKKIFFPLMETNSLTSDEKDVIEQSKGLLVDNDKISINSEIFYNIAITIPQKEITEQLLTFLIQFVEQADNNDLVESEDILPDFIIFYKSIKLWFFFLF